MASNMGIIRGLVGKSLVTGVTPILVLIGMDLLMKPESRFCGIFCPADVAGEFDVMMVRSNVFLHVPSLREGLPTRSTVKGVVMLAHVHGQVVLPGEGLLADVAHEGRA